MNTIETVRDVITDFMLRTGKDPDHVVVPFNAMAALILDADGYWARRPSEPMDTAVAKGKLKLFGVTIVSGRDWGAGISYRP